MRSGLLTLTLITVCTIAACYAPRPQAGSACGLDGTCPTPLVCEKATNTCESAFQDAGTVGPMVDVLVIPPDAMIDARPDARQIDGCTPTREICGDGQDQDCDSIDPPCEGNDRPGAAKDVTTGGSFTGDALLATNDGDSPCNANSGNDLFYKVVLAAPQVYYFDTFNSAFDTTLHVFAGPCTASGMDLACDDDECGGGQSQVAVSLGAGESCIVVDQKAGETMGGVALHVIPAGRDGAELTPGTTQTGTTCNSTNLEDPIDQCDEPGTGGKDVSYWVTQCPGQAQLLDVDTCSAGTDYDSVLYVREVGGMQLDCNDDNCNGGASEINNVSLANGVMFWVIVDGWMPDECGNYRLHSNLH